MILVAIAGVALFVAGAIRVAARDARLPEHEIEGRPNYAMVAGTALMLIGALGAAIAALLNY